MFFFGCAGNDNFGLVVRGTRLGMNNRILGLSAYFWVLPTIYAGPNQPMLGATKFSCKAWKRWWRFVIGAEAWSTWPYLLHGFSIIILLLPVDHRNYCDTTVRKLIVQLGESLCGFPSMLNAAVSLLTLSMIRWHLAGMKINIGTCKLKEQFMGCMWPTFCSTLGLPELPLVSDQDGRSDF